MRFERCDNFFIELESFKAAALMLTVEKFNFARAPGEWYILRV